jgi:hypothetical protein
MSNFITRWRLLWSVPVLLLAVGGIAVAKMMQPPPADLDLSLARPTYLGLYVASIEPTLSPITVGTMHRWVVQISPKTGVLSNKPILPLMAACRSTVMACRPNRRSAPILATVGIRSGE